mmetsp:Transcript_37412/g.48410  ORF Transcript_37412/g.48410 Transcript_37412/m.48410 type:complete len:478 (+) Transcript_37412:384-1817(+)
MWTSHTVYHPFLHSIVPGLKTSLVTIIRKPDSRWISAFQFYGLPQRFGYLPRQNDSLWLDKNLKVVGTISEVAEDIINKSWIQFSISNFQNLSSLSNMPSQWAYNGMSMELAGSVHGSLQTLQDAIGFSELVKVGQWMKTKDVDSSGRELVMILEKFEESVVVLGLLLGVSTGDGLSSQLLYSRPMNPTEKKSRLHLSSSIRKKLNALVVADDMLYGAANLRLSLLIQCFEKGLLDCFDNPQPPSQAKNSPSQRKQFLFTDLVESHIKSVELAKQACLTSQNSFCEDLELSDAKWHRRMNGRIEATGASSQVLNEFSIESLCTSLSDSDSLLSFSCVAGDYSNAPPIGIHSGRLLSVGGACLVEELENGGHSKTHLVALVHRGGCSFRQKALVLQEAGFSSALLVDYASEDTLVTPSLGQDINIAIVMISFKTWQHLSDGTWSQETSVDLEGRATSQQIGPKVDIKLQRSVPAKTLL